MKGACPLVDKVKQLVLTVFPWAKRLKGIGLYWRFVRNFFEFSKLSSAISDRFTVRWQDRYPCLWDATPSTHFDRHYVYHTAWAARILAVSRPEVHVDISSALYFSALVSAFVPVRHFDYRQPDIQLDNLTVGSTDLTALAFPDRSVSSLSCMHVVEHVGLGRYGDPLDPTGDMKAIGELKRVLAPGGSLLFVVPVGKPKIMFNAHRIYSVDQVLEYFGDLHLREFTLIPEHAREGGLIKDSPPHVVDAQDYACGCFWFTREE